MSLATTPLVTDRRRTMRTTNSTETRDSDTAQGHLTLTFPMKSPADCAAVRSLLPAFDRRAVPSGGRDGYAALLPLHRPGRGARSACSPISMANSRRSLTIYPEHFGPVLDPVLAHVSDPPPTPVANHAKAFGDWATDQFIKPFVELRGRFPAQRRSKSRSAGHRGWHRARSGWRPAASPSRHHADEGSRWPLWP